MPQLARLGIRVFMLRISRLIGTSLLALLLVVSIYGAVITLPRHWIKPAAGSQIRWGNQLSRGLVFCLLMNEGGGTPRDATGRSAVPATTSATVPTWTSDIAGTGRKYVRASSEWDEYGTLNTGIQFNAVPFTILALFRTNSSPSAVQQPAGMGLAAKAGYGFRMSTGNVNRFATATTTGGSFVSVTGSTINTATLINAVGTMTGAGAMTYYENGVLQGTASQGSPNLAEGTAVAFRTGTDNSSAAAFDGTLFLVVIWNRVLNFVEIQALQVDPYAFMIPPSPHAFFIAPIPAGGAVRHKAISQ